jgi:hypothetical protein
MEYLNEVTISFIIASMCKFKDPKLTRDYKEMCIEEMINCAANEKAKYTRKSLELCFEEKLDRGILK